ncbi:MAG: hypothetical protein ACPGO3_09970 [Magnetospiraceae bacterium]
MAQLLIHATGRVNLTDATKDAELYKAGDVVAVFEDSWTWGRKEHFEVWHGEGRPEADWPGDFYLVKLPRVAVEAARYLLTSGESMAQVWTRRAYLANAPILERRAPGYYEEGHPRAGRRRDTMTAYKWIERADVGLTETGFITQKPGIGEWLPEELR